DAAHKIGDDYLQKRARGQVVPDSFTHGSSAQRVQWFNTGLKSGQVANCDTFNQNIYMTSIKKRSRCSFFYLFRKRWKFLNIFILTNKAAKANRAIAKTVYLRLLMSF